MVDAVFNLKREDIMAVNELMTQFHLSMSNALVVLAIVLPFLWKMSFRE